MALVQMLALAVVSASPAVPADTSKLATEAPGVRCQLVLETSSEKAGRTQKTFLSRCPGLPSSRLQASYNETEPRIPATIRPR